METLFYDFRQAHLLGSGPLLSSTLVPIAPAEDPNRLRRFSRSSTSASIAADIRAGILYKDNSFRISKQEGSAWVDVYASYWRAINEIVALSEGIKSDHNRTYESWKELTNCLIKGYSSSLFGAWTVPCLYVVGRYLRIFAIKADATEQNVKPLMFDAGLQDDVASSAKKSDKLEEAARIINRIFTLCISDSLSKNILRAIQASRTDMPALESFPKSHIVTFNYYVGVILFLEENYEKAEEHLTDAWKHCHRDAARNRELILTYLIPCHLLTTHTLPSAKLLRPYPRLQSLYSELSRCIRKGDLAGFDRALAAGEDEFVKRRIYLTLERGRDIALRNLLRKVYLAAGFEDSKDGGPPIRRTRIQVAEFAAAIRLGTDDRHGNLGKDEVECLLANMIYKNLMKGYIARERGIVVLSKGSAFPGTNV